MTTKRQEQFWTGFRSVQRLHSWVTAKVLMLLFMLVVGVQGAIARDGTRSTQNYKHSNGGIEYLLYKTTAYSYYNDLTAGPSGSDDPKNGGFNTSDPSAADYLPTKMVAVVNKCSLGGNVTIPSSVTYYGDTYTVVSLGYDLFLNNSSVTSLTIPSSVRIIEHDVFNEANGIRNLVLEGGDKPLFCYYSGNSAAYFKGAFTYMSGLQNITLGRTLKCGTTKDYAPFYHNDNNVSNKSITITSEVKEIPDYCFSGMKNVSGISMTGVSSDYLLVKQHSFENISPTRFSIGRNVCTDVQQHDPLFSGMSNIKSLTVTEGCRELVLTYYDSKYDKYNRTSRPAFPTLALDELDLTNATNLIEIPVEAFKGGKMESVKIPSSLRAIGRSAFENCTNLKDVDFSEATSLDAIQNYAFKNSGIETLDLSKTNMQSIMYLSDMPSLKTLITGKALKYISYSFTNVPSLEHIDVSQSILFDNITQSFSELRSLKVANLHNTQIDDDDIHAIVGGSTSLEELYLPPTATMTPAFGSLALRVLDMSQCTQITKVQGGYNSEFLEEISIPSSVQEIGNWVFAKCSNLKTVTFAANPSLTKIGERAFLDCSKLESFCVEGNTENFYGMDNLSSIGEHTFDGCACLTNVKFSSPAKITELGVYAFANTGLTEFDFSGMSNITSVSEGLLSGSKVTAVNLPAGVTEIGRNAYANTEIVNLVMPSSVTKISNGAFRDCKKMETADLTASTWMTELPMSLFYGCSALHSLNLPSALIKIGESCFAGCDALTDASQFLTSSIKEIESGAFMRCHNLVKADLSSCTGMNIVPNSLFSHCENLSTVILPAGITEIGWQTFYGCKSITEFDCSPYPNLCSFQEYAFAETGIERIVLPDNITTVGKCMFQKCDNLVSVTFGTTQSKLASIGQKFTEECKNLQEIRFANATSITEIPSDAFKNCESLKFFDFENLPNLESIGSNAFQNTGLENVVIRDNITEVKYGAFCYCRNLKEVRFGQSNSKLKTIGGGVLAGSSVENIIFARNEVMTEIPQRAFSGTDRLLSINLTSLIKLKDIAAYAFSEGAIQSVVLPLTVETIGNYAFERCQDLTNINLTSLNALTYVGSGAFFQTGLTSITFPNNVTSVGDRVVNECPNLTTIQFGTSQSKIASLGEKIASANVKSIKFCNATQLTEIASAAFQGCTNLKTFDFVSLPNLTTIGDNAFNKAGLTSVVLQDNVTTIGENAFANCPNLKSIQFGKSKSKISSLGIGFLANSPIDNVKFLNATLLTAIPDNAFTGKNITSFDFTSVPNLVTIGYCAFQNTLLKSVVLHDNITTVADGAFGDCRFLEEVTLGVNCRTLGARSFFSSAIHRVYVNTDIATTKMTYWNENKLQFNIDQSLCVLIMQGVNEGKTDYQEQYPWKSFNKVLTNEVSTLQVKGLTWKIYRNGKYSYDIKGNFGVHNIDGAVLTGGSFSGDVEIPDYVAGFPVIAVTKGIFNGKSSITSISFPGTLRMIENNAVEKMSNLKKVEFRDQRFPRGEKCYIGYAVYSVEDEEAFYKCDALEEVVIGCDIDFYDGEDEPFEDRDNLKRIRITASCHTIGKEDCVLFNDCDTELDELIFDDCDTELTCLGKLFSGFYGNTDTSAKSFIIGRSFGYIGDIQIDEYTLSNTVTKLTADMIPWDWDSDGRKIYGGKNVTEIEDWVRLNRVVVDKPWLKLKRIGDNVRCPENLWVDPANPWESSLTYIGKSLEAGNKIILPPSIEFVGEGSIPFGEGRPESSNSSYIHVPDLVNIYIYADLAKLTMEGNVWKYFDSLRSYINDVTIHCLCNTDMGKIEAKFPDVSNWPSKGSPKRLRDLHLQESKKGSTLQSDGLYHDVCEGCGGNDRSSKTGNYYIHNWNGSDDIMIHKDGSSYSYAGPLAIDDSKPFQTPVSFSAESVSYNRTVTGGRVATFVLPFASDASEVNGTVYKFREFKDNKFCFDEQTGALDANIPYLVVVNEEATQLLSDVTATSLAATVSNTLSPLACNVTNGTAQHIGSFVQQSLKDGDNNKSYYGYASNDGMFVKAQTATLNPFRTMFALSQSSNANARIRLQLGDDDTTSIINVDADLLDGDGSPMYDLNGRVITSPVHGQIYIQNGKKISSK